MNAKRAVVLGSIGLFLTSLIAAAVAQSTAAPHEANPGQAAANAAGPKKAEQQFKNIQVLKGIPADQLFPTMQFITASLGVQCDFCHVQGAFEKDDKPTKQKARKMMEMMIAINADNFDGHRAVTCNTCHNGTTKPQAIPAVMTEEPKEAMGGPKPPEAGTTPQSGSISANRRATARQICAGFGRSGRHR